MHLVFPSEGLNTHWSLRQPLVQEPLGSSSRCRSGGLCSRSPSTLLISYDSYQITHQWGRHFAVKYIFIRKCWFTNGKMLCGNIAFDELLRKYKWALLSVHVFSILLIAPRVCLRICKCWIFWTCDLIICEIWSQLSPTQQCLKILTCDSDPCRPRTLKEACTKLLI